MAGITAELCVGDLQRPTEMTPREGGKAGGRPLGQGQRGLGAEQ